MKFLFVGCVFLLMSLNSFGSTNWFHVGKSTEGNIFFLDLNSVQKSGDLITFWGRSNQAVRGAGGFMSSKTQDTINCRNREIVLRYLIAYDQLNNRGSVVVTVKPDPEWRPISPDSINWEFYNILCKNKSAF